MRLALVIVGILVILAALWFRALRKLTVDLTAVWGLLGILLILAGTVTPVSVRIMEGLSGAGQAAAIVGILCLAAGFRLSLILSRLTAKNQELAIEVSLLRQENVRIRTELEEVTGDHAKQEEE